MSNQHVVLEVRSLDKSIHSGTHLVEILRDINFAIEKGSFAVIEGPSGSGKSTLLGLLAGLDRPTAGEIMLDGQSISELPENRMALLRGQKIGFVFQAYQLIPTLNALENVLLPLELTCAQGSDLRDRAIDLLKQVGLEERVDHYPVQLSGGEQQRVALARAFVTRPPIVLADEPTGNLDIRNGEIVLEMLMKLNQQTGTTLVMVTHDEKIARRADRRITLEDGRVVSDTLAIVPVEGSRSPGSDSHGAGW